VPYVILGLTIKATQAVVKDDDIFLGVDCSGKRLQEFVVSDVPKEKEGYMSA
jgi:hypothetical protein